MEQNRWKLIEVYDDIGSSEYQSDDDDSEGSVKQSDQEGSHCEDHDKALCLGIQIIHLTEHRHKTGRGTQDPPLSSSFLHSSQNTLDTRHGILGLLSILFSLKLIKQNPHPPQRNRSALLLPLFIWKLLEFIFKRRPVILTRVAQARLEWRAVTLKLMTHLVQDKDKSFASICWTKSFA